MAYDLEEQEKLDAVKAWWERYGTLCVVLICLVVAAAAGWRGWQWYQGHQATQAMGYFEALETAAGEQDDDAIGRLKAASATLRSDFPGSGYTSRGVLVAAQALQARGDLDAAREQLTWMVQQGKDPALVPLARLRLADILLAQSKYDEALAQLQNPPAAFVGLFDDRRGDILAAQGKIEDARKAWESAMAALKNDPLQQVIELKLDASRGA